ncbi:MAG: PD-(D/E)XK nuclease family protein [Muribaculaceae bacterium]|nr:PD-(D/E)XK nuclease family protein [Muribaculaceae bacterium]
MIKKTASLPSGQAPRPFLESVARAYNANYDDLSEFCFVFPNKRAGTFFLKHLHDASKRTSVAPFVTSITDFVALLADHDVASRIDLLFRLYNIYRSSNGENRTEGGERIFTDFDSFRNWGETLISDFSEVDQYDVDADSLFRNVKDYREISSSFLTDEQIEVMVRYFGYAPGIREVERFWRNMEPPSDIKNRFLLLWQQMAPLYHALNDSLHSEKLCTSGGAYRLALRRLREKGREIVPWKKVVIVGFNALSTTEALIFEELKGLEPTPGIAGDFAEFYWDGTGPVLSGGVNDAATFLKYNRRNFPTPEWAGEWMRLSDTDDMPATLRVIGSPSNSAQGKLAGMVVAETMEATSVSSGGEKQEVGEAAIHDAKVAVVLPDENLLMPFLYALPPGLGGVNLTMGYPLRITSVMSFISHLRRVRATQRGTGEDTAYYHSDLRHLLSHPYVHALAGSGVISEINGWLNHHHKLTITTAELRKFSDPLAELLRPLPAGADTATIIGYLEEVMVTVSVALDKKESGVVKSRIDRSHIEIYRDALRRLGTAASEHGIEMGMAGVFSMVDRLIGGEQVTFEGEPLEGLQVMGLLETRALDFDKLIILSLNDRVMPRKSAGRTFIPDSLRHGYGLPYANYREDLFSYYFYRMISRAREVTMIYDARSSSGMRSGGMSRYLMQLRYLYAPDRLHFENHKFLLSPEETSVRAVEKTPLVKEQLREFTRRGSRRNFSASALKNYFKCPVKFYYENVMGLRAENEPSEYIDAIGLGNVLHEVMFHLYFPVGERNRYLENPIEMTVEKLDALLADRDGIARMVTRAINRHHFHLGDEELDSPLTGAAALVADKIVSQVEDVLAYDRTLAPFSLVGGEISGLVEWPLRDSDEKVNMKYAIDRLDIVTLPDGTRSYRIVDYKTGSSYVRAQSMESVFDGSESAQNLFQLMLYANLMNRDMGKDEAVRLAIYQIAELGKNGEVVPTMYNPAAKGQVKYEPMETHFDHNKEFLERTDTLLAEIFSDEPFHPVDSDDKCRYCNLGHLCGRTL